MQRTTLANGMTILCEKRQAESVAMEVQIKVGSVNENKRQAGMTHLIEHMLFEGTTTRSAHEVSNAIESVGGEFNAATTHERTFYYIHLPKQYFSRAVDIMADIIKNPLFDEKTIKKEKNVVLNEIKVVNDDPKQYQWIAFLNTLFRKHPARHPIYGDSTIIKQMTQEEILAYYTKHYVPSNMTISLIGNIHHPLPLLRKHFGNLRAQQPLSIKPYHEPSPTAPCHKRVKHSAQHSYIIIGYQAVPKAHPDSYPLEVIRSILGRGQSSRLFEEVRTKRGIAYTVGAVYESSLTFGAFASYVSTHREHVKEARTVLHDAFKLHNLTTQEVKDAKDFLVGSFLLHREDLKERADINAEWSLFNTSPEQYIKKIKSVTKDQVLHTAKKYFHRNSTEVLLQK